MSPERIVALVGLLIIVLTALVIIARRLPKRIKTSIYVRKWRDIQKLCGHKDDWSHAIVHADMLLDEVLKKRKVVGKTMGERMVNAQSRFSSNDSIWNAHKLANMIRQEGTRTMKETDVKNALVAFRQALRDLGALS
ncbi:hypothetical protein KC992_04250 [Candidatus Saccharibacteria bacterium]|nr:hypothetical protein [Candidatus Saccharibacteria bacterium]MCA9328209.1 hypothetical protein [Candidatus Saccharibacteria bacterium]